jgi:alpha-D-ribose 1-methylphosphonate 5-triphosphate synthase subunit PhnG
MNFRMPDAQSPPAPPPDERRRWIGILARADAGRLETAWTALPDRPTYRHLRQPEIGLAMVRGRIGGAGQRFNLGEMTMARAAVVTADGFTGFGYVAGRDLRHAELAALFDALLQDAGRRPPLVTSLIEPLEQDAAARRTARAQAVQASKVEFFTMVRGA